MRVQAPITAERDNDMLYNVSPLLSGAAYPFAWDGGLLFTVSSQAESRRFRIGTAGYLVWNYFVAIMNSFSPVG